MSILDMQQIPDASTSKAQHQYYNGDERTIYVTDEAFSYPSGQLIISRTDSQGIITYVNEAFIILSSYAEEELIGHPHYIIRHPHMPKSVFKHLWSTITSGRKWHGYIKNLRKDGGYYWVCVTVVPNYRNKQIEGFTSVQRQASVSNIQKYSALYAQMLAKEK